MERLLSQVKRYGNHSTKRTFEFGCSADLKLFLQQYKMNIEKCLKSMAMEESCQAECSERPIYEFGGPGCSSRCALNAETALSQSERHVILYSMIYVDFENKNLHPNVREHLWSRASGATQLMKTYEGYPVDANAPEGMRKDYYTALTEAPNPPNSSVGTIKAD